MVAVIDAKAAPTITTPAGWTLVSTTPNGSNFHQAVYSRVATGSEPASTTWTINENRAVSGVIVAYSGVQHHHPGGGPGHGGSRHHDVDHRSWGHLGLQRGHGDRCLRDQRRLHDLPSRRHDRARRDRLGHPPPDRGRRRGARHGRCHRGQDRHRGDGRRQHRPADRAAAGTRTAAGQRGAYRAGRHHDGDGRPRHHDHAHRHRPGDLRADLRAARLGPRLGGDGSRARGPLLLRSGPLHRSRHDRTTRPPWVSRGRIRSRTRPTTVRTARTRHGVDRGVATSQHGAHRPGRHHHGDRRRADHDHAHRHRPGDLRADLRSPRHDARLGCDGHRAVGCGLHGFRSLPGHRHDHLHGPVGFSGPDSFTYTVHDGTRRVDHGHRVDRPCRRRTHLRPPRTSPPPRPPARPPRSPSPAPTRRPVELTFNRPEATLGSGATIAGLANHPCTETVRSRTPPRSPMQHPGSSGPDSFTYSVHDGTDASATATVSVGVAPAPNAPPIAQDDTAAATAGSQRR